MRPVVLFGFVRFLLARNESKTGDDSSACSF